MERWPLVGRDAALRALVAAGSAGRSVVVRGPVGSGKSRLLREHLDRGHEQAVVVRVAGADALTVPLEARLLVVDDAHLLDPTAAALLLDLVSRDSIRALLTVRSEAAATAPIAVLWEDEVADRITLGPLDRTASNELACHLLGGPPSLRTQEQLWNRAAGNPLALKALLSAAHAAGALAEEQGAWHLDPAVPVPRRLGELAVSRLADLDAVDRTTLELLALAEPAPVALAAALGRTAACERLEARGLLREQVRAGSKVLRADPPLHGEAIVAALPRVRRRRHLEALVGAAGEVPGFDPVRDATWRLECGLPADPELLCRASERARTSDPDLALRLGEAAVAAGAGAVGHAVLAEGLVLGRRRRAARTALDCGEAEARTDAELARVAVAATDWAGLGGNRPGQALQRAQRLRDRLRSPAAADRVDAATALVGAMAGEVAAARAAADRVGGRPDAAAEAVVTATSVLAVTALMTGRTDGLADVLERGERAAREVADRFGLHHLGAIRVSWRAYEAELPAAVDVGRHELRRACERADEAAIGLYGLALAGVLELAGRLDEAAAVLAEAARAVGRCDPFAWRPIVEDMRAVIGIQRGDVARTPLGARVGPVADADIRAVDWAGRVRLWRCATADTAAGADVAVETGQRLESFGAPAWAARTYFDAVRIGHAALVADRMSAIAAAVDGDDGTIPRLARCAVAAAERDAAEVEAAAAGLEDAGMLLPAAEAFGLASSFHLDAGRPSSSARAVTRGELLLERCPGAATPGVTGWRSPLTGREREIARLAPRFGSRDIAARLLLSVRAVDHHLAAVYRKLAVSGRAELAQVLGVPLPATPSDVTVPADPVPV